MNHFHGPDFEPFPFQTADNLSNEISRDTPSGFMIDKVLSNIPKFLLLQNLIDPALFLLV
jgi:hypothetical protein